MATDMIARAMAGNIKKELDNYKNNPDVVDVVQNKAALNAYDTSKLTENDLIKVLDDESKGHMQTYYKWVNNDWSYSGGLGPKADLTNSNQTITADKVKVNQVVSNTDAVHVKSTYSTNIEHRVFGEDKDSTIKQEADKITFEVDTAEVPSDGPNTVTLTINGFKHNGNEIIDAGNISDHLPAKQDPIDVDHKLDADLVTDASSTNKFVTSNEKSQITTNANDIAAIKNGTTLNSFGDVETALAEITPSHLYRMHLKIGTDYAVIGITPTIGTFEVGQTYTVYDGTYRLTPDQRTAMKKVLSGISGNENEVPFQLYGALVNKTIRTCIELTDFSGVTEVKLDFNSTSNNVYTAGGTWTLKFTQLI